MIELSAGYPIWDGDDQDKASDAAQAKETETRNDPQHGRGGMGFDNQCLSQGRLEYPSRELRAGCVGRKTHARRLLALAAFGSLVFAGEPSLQSRVVQVEKQDCVPVYAAYNFSTAIVLPAGEEVRQIAAGESSFWSIDNFGTAVAVKPKLAVKLAKKQIAPTNINIFAASGNAYCVVVSEVSGTDQSADLKVLLEQKNPDALANIESPKWVRSDYAEELKKALALAKQEASQAKHTGGIAELEDLHFDYRLKGKEAEAFGLRAVFHDRRFTYIEAHSQNAPVLYEIGSDGKAIVIQYELQNGLYVVQHIMDHGQLKAGKKKVDFERIKEG